MNCADLLPDRVETKNKHKCYIHFEVCSCDSQLEFVFDLFRKFQVIF